MERTVTEGPVTITVKDKLNIMHVSFNVKYDKDELSEKKASAMVLRIVKVLRKDMKVKLEEFS